MSVSPCTTRLFYPNYIGDSTTGCVFSNFIDQIQGNLIMLPQTEAALANRVIRFIHKQLHQNIFTSSHQALVALKQVLGPTLRHGQFTTASTFEPSFEGDTIRSALEPIISSTQQPAVPHLQTTQDWVFGPLNNSLCHVASANSVQFRRSMTTMAVLTINNTPVWQSTRKRKQQQPCHCFGCKSNWDGFMPCIWKCTQCHHYIPSKSHLYKTNLLYIDVWFLQLLYY